MMIPDKLKTIVRENTAFCIASHIKPEGDAIGSMLALGLGLKKLGKDVYMFNKDKVPDILTFLPYSKEITSEIPFKTFDVFFILDCNHIKRVGVDGFRAKITAVIDHHLSESDTADVKWIVPDASSTGELIYKFLLSLNIEIDRDIATNLYTSIFTDTGGFRFPNTKSETLRISAELMETDINVWEINKALYESYPLKRMKLLGHSLSTLHMEDGIAWITVTNQMYEDTGSNEEDTENLVNYPRMIKGVEVAILFREVSQNSYKISIRSKDRINVAAIAEHFDGGGHFNAAGFLLKGSLEDVQQKVIATVKNAFKVANY